MKTNQLQKNIPIDWKEIKLGDVLKVGSGKDYKHLGKGSVPVFGTGGYMLSVNKPLYSGETVFIGRKGTIDKPFYYNGDFWTVDTLFYTYNFKNTTAKYINNIFKKINWKLYNEASGVPSLSKTTIEKIKFNLPPLPEQARIVAVLETWDKAIEKWGKKIEMKKLTKKGLMQDLLSGKRRLRGFDDRWKKIALQDICQISMGQSPASIAYNEIGNGLPLIQGNNDIKNRKTIARVWTTEITKSANKGDIIMTVRAPVGCIGVASEDVCIGRGVCAFKPTKANANFLLQLLEWRENHWKVFEQGSTFTAVNSSDVKKLSLLIPKSEEEQDRIANILMIIDNEIKKMQEKLDLFKDQKKYLLNNLITGTIRTPEFMKVNI